jgi:hypothetical protein
MLQRHPRSSTAASFRIEAQARYFPPDPFLMPTPDPKRPPQPTPPARGTAPQQPPPAAPPAVKKEDISRWEGEGGAPSTGSQGRSKDGTGTGKLPTPKAPQAPPPPRRT